MRLIKLHNGFIYVKFLFFIKIKLSGEKYIWLFRANLEEGLYSPNPSEKRVFIY